MAFCTAPWAVHRAEEFDMASRILAVAVVKGQDRARRRASSVGTSVPGALGGVGGVGGGPGPGGRHLIYGATDILQLNGVRIPAGEEFVLVCIITCSEPSLQAAAS
eukprot:1149423-Pelagomonas_calceolata.AAC.2